MYAIVKTGGKQYKVAEGDLLNVEKLDAEIGAEVTLDVLMLVDGDSVKVGKLLLRMPMSWRRSLNTARSLKSSSSSTNRRRITARSRAIVSPTPGSRSCP